MFTKIFSDLATRNHLRNNFQIIFLDSSDSHESLALQRADESDEGRRDETTEDIKEKSSLLEMTIDNDISNKSDEIKHTAIATVEPCTDDVKELLSVVSCYHII